MALGSTRWALVLVVQLLVLATALHAFRLRDAPSGDLAGEELPRTTPQGSKKCDTCGGPDAPGGALKYPATGASKFKQTAFVEKSADKSSVRAILHNNPDVLSKKPIIQIKKPSFTVKITKKDDDDDSDEDDTEEDSDDSDAVTTESDSDEDDTEKDNISDDDNDSVTDDDESDDDDDSDDDEDSNESEDGEKINKDDSDDDDDDDTESDANTSDNDSDDDDDDSDKDLKKGDSESDDTDDSEDDDDDNESDTDGATHKLKLHLGNKNEQKTSKSIIPPSIAKTVPKISITSRERGIKMLSEASKQKVEIYDIKDSKQKKDIEKSIKFIKSEEKQSIKIIKPEDKQEKPPTKLIKPEEKHIKSEDKQQIKSIKIEDRQEKPPIKLIKIEEKPPIKIAKLEEKLIKPEDKQPIKLIKTEEKQEKHPPKIIKLEEKLEQREKQPVKSLKTEVNLQQQIKIIKTDLKQEKPKTSENILVEITKTKKISLPESITDQRDKQTAKQPEQKLKPDKIPEQLKTIPKIQTPLPPKIEQKKDVNVPSEKPSKTDHKKDLNVPVEKSQKPDMIKKIDANKDVNKPLQIEPSKISHKEPPKIPEKIEKKIDSHEQDVKKTAEITKQPVKEKKVKVERKVRSKRSQSHAQRAIHRKNLRESEFEDFYTFLPTFAPNFSRIHNPECRRHGQILLRQLRGAKLWPLQMLDSTAKLPSGILRGNGNQLGDYDQCMDVKARVRLDSGSIVKVAGKYCLAQIDLKHLSDELKLPVHLAQARNFIKSKQHDPGHFIPRFTSLNWGVCLPASCDAPEAEFILRDALRHYNGTAGMRITINVEPTNCYTAQQQDWWKEWTDIPTVGTIIFYGLFVSLTFYATFYDVISSRRKSIAQNDDKKETNEVTENAENAENSENAEAPENKKEDNGIEGDTKPEESAAESQNCLVRAFSLKQTTSKLLREGSAEGDIECIHGIRGLCSLALYIAHKLIPLAMTPFTNRTYLTEVSNTPVSVALRASLLYTDTFLLLSGVLTSYHMSQDIDNTGSIPWMRRYITRYIRLTPALVAVLLWYAWISDKIGEGPLWGMVVTQNAELCQVNMWKNIFYLQNFFPFEEMCATHTHQLALDMQLWWLAPVTVWLLRSRPALALLVMGGLHTLTVWLRYSTSLSDHLSLVIYHGITVNQLYRTANLCYSLALHRATPYLAGIGLGVLLQQTGKKIELPKLFYLPGWVICAYFGSWALYTPSHLSMRDYQYNVDEAAQYAALASVAWALCLSWIIFACFTGNGGPINDFLCSRPLVILSRISYSMYLCQFLIFFYNVGSTRTSSEFSFLYGINIPEILAVLLVSVILTLLFDIPMQSAKNFMVSIEASFGRKKSEEEEESKPETTEEKTGENVGEQITEEPNEPGDYENENEPEERTEEEIYDEYMDEHIDDLHHEVDQDIIYEEEEEEIDIEAEGDYVVEDERAKQGEGNDGENQLEDEDLQDWEWTNGGNNYYYRR